MANIIILKGVIRLKKLGMLLMGLLLSMVAFAHSPLLSVDDNEDGTIYVEGGFSNGSTAGGTEILLLEDKAYNGKDESFEGKRVLLKTKLDSEGAAEIIKPNVLSYVVVMNAGPGHVATKKGIKIASSERGSWESLLKEAKAKYKNDKQMSKWLNKISK